MSSPAPSKSEKKIKRSTVETTPSNDTVQITDERHVHHVKLGKGERIIIKDSNKLTNKTTSSSVCSAENHKQILGKGELKEVTAARAANHHASGKLTLSPMQESNIVRLLKGELPNVAMMRNYGPNSSFNIDPVVDIAFPLMYSLQNLNVQSRYHFDSTVRKRLVEAIVCENMNVDKCCDLPKYDAAFMECANSLLDGQFSLSGRLDVTVQ